MLSSEAFLDFRFDTIYRTFHWDTENKLIWSTHCASSLQKDFPSLGRGFYRYLNYRSGSLLEYFLGPSHCLFLILVLVMSLGLQWMCIYSLRVFQPHGAKFSKDLFVLLSPDILFPWFSISAHKIFYLLWNADRSCRYANCRFDAFLGISVLFIIKIGSLCK